METFYVTDDLIASHGQRIVNCLMDFIFKMILMVVIIVCLTILAIITEADGLLNWMQHMNLFYQYLLGVVLTIIYYGLTETLFGRSFGKFISGTVIVMEDGSTPDSDVILKRTFCRLIPFDWVSFLGTPPRGWHDSIPGVYVVDKRTFDRHLTEFRRCQTDSQTESSPI